VSISFEQLHPAFAAEARGVDLRQKIDAATAAAIEDAMNRYAVLVFRDQPIDEAQQMEFTRWFGALDGGFGKIAQRKTRFQEPTLADISNVDLEGRIVSRFDRKLASHFANQLWHSDSSFQPEAAKFSILSGHAVPSRGGETEFADMRAAYDALPADIKAEVDGLEVEHWALHSRFFLGDTDYTEAQKNAIPAVRWPVVRVHPGSQRKTLFIGAHAREIVGLPLPEGRVMLLDLLEHSTRPEFVHRHHWRVGDVVMWDNRCTLHRGRRYDMSERRELRRSTTIETAAPSERVA
jgi:alpha-ketoglutarate-dependent 2,4-dichlorophenoxyacetate dioxygenase